MARRIYEAEEKQKNEDQQKISLLLTETTDSDYLLAIEKVGEKLRAMMPWIGKNKLVDKSKN